MNRIPYIFIILIGFAVATILISSFFVILNNQKMLTTTTVTYTITNLENSTTTTIPVTKYLKSIIYESRGSECYETEITTSGVEITIIATGEKYKFEAVRITSAGVILAGTLVKTRYIFHTSNCIIKFL
jgi:hypothetical protein